MVSKISARKYSTSYLDGLNAGYRAMMKTYYHTRHQPASLSLKTAFLISQACKNVQSYAQMFQSGAGNLKNVAAWAKKQTLEFGQLQALVSNWDALQTSIPRDVDGDVRRQIKELYGELQAVEKLWPSHARNANLFTFATTEKGKVVAQEIIARLKAASNAAQGLSDQLGMQSSAAEGDVEEKANLYAALNNLKPQIDQLKTALNPAPGQPIPRIEVKLIQDVFESLSKIANNPHLPNQYVGTVNEILKILDPLSGRGVVNRVQQALYQWVGWSEREIRNALTTAAGLYSRMLTSIRQRG